VRKERNRSACPVACFLDILGDRWTMLIVRDLLLGAKKYNEFLTSPEKITTNILADRLKRLEAEGLVKKTAYQNNPVRYSYGLTQKGKDLQPLMKSMINWVKKYKDEVIRFAPGKTDKT
jgi:DNA-binding HxlR family transcriptional regulator